MALADPIDLLRLLWVDALVPELVPPRGDGKERAVDRSASISAPPIPPMTEPQSTECFCPPHLRSFSILVYLCQQAAILQFFASSLQEALLWS